MTIKSKIYSAGLKVIDTLLPPRCVISGDPVDRQGMISPDIWQNLNFIADPKCGTCGFPFEFEVQEGSFCASCLDYPPSFDSAHAALKYDEASRSIILGFKHADKTHAALAFTPWLVMAGQEALAHADLIIPVPLHPRRLIARRYNQAAIMAQYLAKETGIPTCLDALKRTRATVPQGYMSSKERFKNVRKAFALNPKTAPMLKGKTIILIDDVYTTGATVNECTKTLQQAQTKEIHILTLARVVREGFG